MILDSLCVLALGVATGCHAGNPWRFAERRESAARWARGALLVLASGAWGLSRLLADHPDATLVAGLRLFPPASRLGLWLLIAGLGVLATDLLLAAAGDHIEALGWRLAAVLGLLLLVITSLALHRLLWAAGPEERPPSGLGSLLAPLLLAAVWLAAADLFAPSPGREASGLGRWGLAPFAALAAAGHAAWLAPELRRLTAGTLPRLELALAILLLLAAGRLHGRWQRLAVVAGLAAHSLFLAQLLAGVEASVILRA